MKAKDDLSTICIPGTGILSGRTPSRSVQWQLSLFIIRLSSSGTTLVGCNTPSDAQRQQNRPTCMAQIAGASTPILPAGDNESLLFALRRKEVKHLRGDKAF